MKKILFVCHTLSHGGGSEKVLSILLNKIVDYYDVSVIERMEDNIQHLQIPNAVHKLASMSHFSPSIVTLKDNESWLTRNHHIIQSFLLLFIPSLVYRKYIQQKYDYEISFNYLHPSFIIAHSFNKKSKKIMWVHSDIYDLNYKQFSGLKRISSFVKYYKQKKAFKVADKIIAISKLTRKSIVDLYPKYKNKITLIHNGYNFNEIIAKSKEYQIINNRFTILAVGTLEKRKNFSLLIQVVIHLIQNYNLDIELDILGQGNLLETLQTEAGQYLDNNIKFLGFKKNPYPYIKAANVLAIPSFSEGFPTVAIESIVLDTPVVSTMVGGIDEIIKPNINGIVVERSVAAFSKAILDIKNNKHYSEGINKTVQEYTDVAWFINVKNMLESL